MRRLLALGIAVLLVAATHLASAEPPLRSLDGARQWINSPPLTSDQLRGKVVLVDFWTYSCINCLRTLPWLNTWAQKYGPQGLVVIGVHAPEFSFEKQQANVAKAVQRLRLSYPVAIDTDFTAWRAFSTNAWPTFHVVDAQGRVRHSQVGENGYEQTERVIQKLLKEAGAAPMTGTTAAPSDGLGLPPDYANLRSPETYLGYKHGAARGIAPDRRQRYAGGEPRLNDWTLAGDWTVRAEHAELAAEGGGIVQRFHARDLHLVMGPAPDGKPIRFRITLDGQPPGDDHGADVDTDGRGEINGERLYQLVRQRSGVRERRFEIRFDAPGTRAYAFTFG